MSQGRIYRLFFNSEFDKNSGDTVCDFNSQIDRTLTPNVRAVHLMSVQCPFMFFAFNSNNNNFAVDISGTTYNVTIPSQYYSNGYEFAIVLEALLNGEFAGFTVGYSIELGVISIVNASVDFEILNDTLIRQKCLAKIGYTQSTLSTLAGNAIVAASPLILLATQSIYIASNNLCTSQSKTGYNLTSNPQQSNILYRIPVNTNAFGLLSFSNFYGDLRFDIADDSFTTINIKLLDDNFDILTAPANTNVSVHFELDYNVPF